MTDTVHTISEISRLKVVGYRDSASGRLVRGEDRRYRIDSVTLRPMVQVEDPTQVEKAHVSWARRRKPVSSVVPSRPT